MSTQIDFRTLPITVPSLCIPRAFTNIDEKRIRRIFDELNMGEIQRVDIVSKTTEKGDKFNRIFVHFRRWFANSNADTARERLLNGKEIKIIYDDPWFWKVSAYREAHSVPRASVKPEHKKASLQFDSDEDSRPSRPANNYSRDQRPRGDQRPRPRDDRRPRDDQRPQQRRQEEVKKIVPRSPSNSPPRQREEQVPQVVSINYGPCPVPVKRRALIHKKPLKIESDETETNPNPTAEKEEGEISD